MEVDKPSAPSRVSLVKAGTHSLEVSWTGSPSVQSYILQIQKYNLPPTTKTSSAASSAVSSTTSATPGVAVVKATPAMIAGQSLVNSGQPTQAKVASNVGSQGAVPKLLTTPHVKGRFCKISFF